MNLIEESEGELHDLSTDSGGCCWNSSLSTTVACLDRRLQFDEIAHIFSSFLGSEVVYLS